MIKVLISLSDMDFSEKLAYRLSETSDRLSIDLIEGPDEYDIVIDDGFKDELLPVSVLKGTILRSYTEKTGKLLYEPQKGLKRVIQFVSPYGGSGLSSIAFSFARVISGRTGLKTLYVDEGIEGRFISGEYTETQRGSLNELKYLVKEKRLADPMRYLSGDHFGPFVICMEKADAEIITDLANAGGFQQVVISGPEKREIAAEDPVNIYVINTGDVRSAEISEVPEGYDFMVRNRDYINNVSGNIIAIAEDGISFKLIDGVMRVSLSGEFGIGIEKLVRAVISEDEKGFLWNMS